MRPQGWAVMATRLVDRDWSIELAEARRRSGGALRVICPFIKTQPVIGLLGAVAPRPLEVLTRFNLRDFGSGVSDIEALRAILEAGGRIRGVRGLHAKVFLFGESRAAITSANLTSRGLEQNLEFGCVSDDAEFVKACRRYFDRLWRAAAGSDLTSAQLDEWDVQVSAFLASGGIPELKAVLPDHGVAVDPDPLPRIVTPGWPAESSQAFVKFFGEGHNRVPRTFDVLEEVRRGGCHWAYTYPKGRRPRQVEDGDTLFAGRLVNEPNDTIIFGRAIGLAHVPGEDDASDAEIADRPWKARWPHYIRVHHAEFVAGQLTNGVRLSELMDVLEADAFASTQRNHGRGVGNVNPRLAVRQQAAVRLTSEGASWLTERLERSFDFHGRVPADELAKLDWPTAPRALALMARP
jgi:PLD-like domain